MSTTGKIFTVLFSILLVGLIAFGIIWGVNNSNSIKEGLSGSNLYTEEDLKKAHEEGYNEALENEENYLATIDELRDNLTNVTDNLSRVNLELQKALEDNKGYAKQVEDLEKLKTENEQTISTLEAEIKSNESVISGLETNKTELQSCISNLEEQITEHNNTILSLEDSISVLEAEKENLIAELNTSEGNCAELEIEISELEEEISVLNSEKQSLISQNNLLSGQIESLNNQLDNLKRLNLQLESINTGNLSTIATLNSQIQSLNSQIADIMLASQNSTTIISNLNAEIDKLEESIAYYEEYISSLETNDKVIVTFEFDESVYNVQAINKGSSASVVTPTSTDYVIFNYWTVNGEQIDLSTYTFVESTKVVADVTYKYDVKFMVDTTTHNSQIVTNGDCAVLPTNPTKQGYEFDGWSIDGVNVVDNISTTPVTSNVTYKAVFTKLHTVTFMVDNKVEDTQTIRNGEYASNVNIESTTYKVFNGWTLNGSIVDVNTQKIVSDTTFVASFTYKYDVKFMVDTTTHNSQIVTSGTCATLPTAPTKQGYEFDGWSINGVNVVDNISTTPVTSNVIYKAVFTKLHTVTFMVENEVEDTQTIRNGEYATNVSIESTTYKVFNGWTLNGSIVDITTQKIVSDTTFIASFTYKHKVDFIVDGEEYNSQIVTSGTCATLPEDPTKQGYEFDGWSLTPNGEVVSNITTMPVTGTMTYYAVFEKIDGLLNEEGEVIYTFSELEDLGYVTTSIDDNEVYTLESVNTAYINGKLILPEGINSISNSAFENCSGLTSITIPNSVTSIGNKAFLSCTSLYEVELPNTITVIDHSTFRNCSSLEDITIPSGVTSIGASTFLGCSNLTNISIPEGVISLGDRSFSYCENLESIMLPSTLITIGSSSFSNCSELESVNIPDGVTIIDSYTFSSCSNLKSITIPSTITRIGQDAFFKCFRLVEVYNLSSLNITEGSTANGYVGYYALDIHTSTEEKSGFYTLGDYIMYNNNENYYLVEYIGNDAEITLPITSYNYSIHQRVFFDNKELTKIVLSSNVTNIGDYAFSSCSSLTSIIIPNGVTSIGESAFSSCSSLVSISLPSSITSVGKGSFSNCSNLVSAILDCNITNIAVSMFYNCSMLTDLTLPSTLTNIGSSAFFKTGLTTLTLENVIIGERAFESSNIINLTLTGNVELSNRAFINTDLVNLSLSGNIIIGELAFSDNLSL